MGLSERLAGVERLTQPTWVFDNERGRIVWANQAALDLWRAPSRDELLSRDFSNRSEATRTRHDAHFVAFREGRVVEEEWTWYPHGEPITVRCAFSGITLDDGRLATLCEARGLRTELDAIALRGIEALRHTPTMVSLMDRKGRLLMQNPAALRAFGERASLPDWLPDAETLAELESATAAGEVFREELQVQTLDGPRFHALEARPTLDPATGALAILVHQVDVTERREREALIEAQRRQIATLSAPILSVGPSALAVPIIGAMDGTRCAELMARLLGAVVERRARHVILDLTGVDTAELASVEHLGALVRALALLGAQPVLTAAPPALARSMAQAGIALDGVLVLRTLHEALRICAAGAR